MTVMLKCLIKRNSYMLRTIITIAILLNVVGLHAQKSNPRGIYHLVSITGKNGTEYAELYECSQLPERITNIFTNK